MNVSSTDIKYRGISSLLNFKDDRNCQFSAGDFTCFAMISRDISVMDSWSFHLDRVQYSLRFLHAEHAKTISIFLRPKIAVGDKNEKIRVNVCRHPLQLDQFKSLSLWRSTCRTELTRLKRMPSLAMCKQCGAVQRGRHSPR